MRAATRLEMDNIQRRLAPETVQSRREEVLSAREAELREVVDEHDLAVREKFHLERFVSILEGWNPEVGSLSLSADASLIQ